jgi:hypothetical protein
MRLLAKNSIKIFNKMAAMTPEKESPYSNEEEEDRAAAAVKADALAEQARSEMIEASVTASGGGGSGRPARRQSALAGMGVFEGVSTGAPSCRAAFVLLLTPHITAQSRPDPWWRGGRRYGRVFESRGACDLGPLDLEIRLKSRHSSLPSLNRPPGCYFFEFPLL